MTYRKDKSSTEVIKLIQQDSFSLKEIATLLSITEHAVWKMMKFHENEIWKPIVKVGDELKYSREQAILIIQKICD